MVELQKPGLGLTANRAVVECPRGAAPRRAGPLRPAAWIVSACELGSRDLDPLLDQIVGGFTNTLLKDIEHLINLIFGDDQGR